MTEYGGGGRTIDMAGEKGIRRFATFSFPSAPYTALPLLEHVWNHMPNHARFYRYIRWLPAEVGWHWVSAGCPVDVGILSEIYHVLLRKHLGRRNRHTIIASVRCALYMQEGNNAHVP